MSRRRVGLEKADEALILLLQLPTPLVAADDKLDKEAATLKSECPVTYADPFCIATALRSMGQILTNDPEYRAVQHLIKVVWLKDNA